MGPQGVCMLKAFRKITPVVALVAFIAVMTSPSVGQVMGICAGWMPTSSYCTLATPALEIGTTQNANPIFNIGVNDGGDGVATLIVLIPQTSTTALNSLTFSATFSQTGQTDVTASATAFTPASGHPFVSNQELLHYLGLVCGSNGNCNGVDYHFDSINGVQAVAGTLGYTVYKLNTPFTVLGPTLAGGPTIVGVSFSSFSSGTGFPVGTIFLALGRINGNILYKTPLTLGEEVTPVPEPVSLTLFGAGLLAVGGYVRRRAKHSRK